MTADVVVATMLLLRKPGSKTVIAVYIKKALAKPLAIFKPKRSILSSQDWILYIDDALVHTAASVQQFRNRGKGVKTIRHLALFTQYRPSRLFLFQRIKSELAGLSLSQDNFRMSCDGIVQTIAKDEFADAFRL
jgi:hypothetical protein